MRYGRQAIVIGMLVASFAHAGIDTMESGRKHCDLFYEGETAAIWSNMSPEMQAALGSEDQLAAFRVQALEQLGNEAAIVAEEQNEVGGVHVYLRTARFEKVDSMILIQWAFDDDGIVAGFTIRPVATEAPTDFAAYESRTKFRLPFEGEWFVFWGGRSVQQNYHAATVDQRFAYDILKMKDGATHQGEGKSNADYYCFGERILAPGAGVVVAMANDVEDNVPGEMNPSQALGNHVILDHGNDEYSFMAHFKQGSVVVEQGQQVAAAELLGLCGNSGNTTEAHLHYHLQNTPVFGQGQGLPVQFERYSADGENVTRGEPVQGQTIRPE